MGQCGETCRSRVVVSGRERRSPEGHDGIADVLLEDAVVRADLLGHDGEVAIEEFDHGCRRELLAHRREARQVGEQDGGDAAFRLVQVLFRGVDDARDDAWVEVLPEGFLDPLLVAKLFGHAVEGLGELADLVPRWPWPLPRPAGAPERGAWHRPRSSQGRGSPRSRTGRYSGAGSALAARGGSGPWHWLAQSPLSVPPLSPGRKLARTARIEGTVFGPPRAGRRCMRLGPHSRCRRTAARDGRGRKASAAPELAPAGHRRRSVDRRARDRRSHASARSLLGFGPSPGRARGGPRRGPLVSYLTGAGDAGGSIRIRRWRRPDRRRYRPGAERYR